MLAFLAAAALLIGPRPLLAQDDEAFDDEGADDGASDDESEGGEFAEPEPAEGSEEARPVKVSAFIFPEVSLDARIATEVVAGLRRGIRADKRLDWVDPSKAIRSDAESEEEPPSKRGLDLLMEAIDQSNTGRWRNVVRTLDDAIELFESDLNHTPRRALVDATMLWGAAWCQLNRQRVCESAFRRVVTFRENAVYDPEILPPEPESVFQQVLEETLSGERGSLGIETEPPGAEVFVDGRFVGASPTRAEGLLGGDHYVTLKMVGYQRLVQRVTVQTDFEATATFELLPMENAPLLNDALASARGEMGQARIGSGMRDLWSLLFIDQVILGEIHRVGETEEFDLTLYLYDLRTSHGLNRLSQRLNWESQNLPEVEGLAADLYRDVDLTGRIRPVDEALPPPARRPDPFYRTWWFWSIIGVVVVGTTIGVASIPRDQLPPGVVEADLPF